MHALDVTLWVTCLALSIPLFAVGTFSAYWTTYAWHSPENFEGTKFVKTRDSTRFSFSAIVPVREENEAVLGATIEHLLNQTHPRLEIVVSVGYDDPETLAIVRRMVAEDRTNRLKLSISTSDVHNKPTQLNAALKDCSGDIIGILDAESLSAPDLFTQVDAAFQSGATVVQGGVIMTNYRTSWVALRSCLEYYVHHRSKMHFSSANGAILMGGNTVFFKRELLDELHGWDEVNLAEDAEISLRIMAMGHDVTVAYDAHLVSLEEAPVSLWKWARQRTRWNLGFLQTIQRGYWRTLPTKKQQRMALWHLLQPSVMSFTGLVLPISIAAYFLSHPPLGVAMMTWLPIIPTLFTVTMECILLYYYTHEHTTDTARIRDYAKLAITTPIYQLMLAFGALRADWKYLSRDFRWEKTVHVGEHITPVTAHAVAPDQIEAALRNKELA